MLCRLGRGALVAGICICYLTNADAGEAETAARPLPSAGQREVCAALHLPVDVDFQARPLADALRQLERDYGVAILLDNAVFDDSRSGAEIFVTLTLKNIRLRSALRLLFLGLDLTYVVDDGRLLVTTRREAESRLIAKVYPVHDLVTLDSGFRPAPPKRDESAGLSGGATSLFGTPINPPDPTAGDFQATAEADNMVVTQVYPVFDLVVRPPDAPITRPGLDFQSLIDDITSNIAPITWDEVGGPGGIREFTNSAALVISQTAAIHAQIAAYLRAMREVAAVRDATR